jgi:hypothetical protein
MSDLPILPDWVLIEAAKRCGWADAHTLDTLQRFYGQAPSPYRALCDMIAKHEEKPVDRKLLCAREAMARNEVVGASNCYRNGEVDDGLAVQDCLRAIELWIEGYGE